MSKLDPNGWTTAPGKLRCWICGEQTGKIRDCEVETAKITRRAHVDCCGHTQYRVISASELPPDKETK